MADCRATPAQDSSETYRQKTRTFHTAEADFATNCRRSVKIDRGPRIGSGWRRCSQAGTPLPSTHVTVIAVESPGGHVGRHRAGRVRIIAMAAAGEYFAGQRWLPDDARHRHWLR